VKLHLSAVGRVFRIDRIRKQKTALGVMARDGAGLAEVVDAPDGVRGQVRVRDAASQGPVHRRVRHDRMTQPGCQR
jgi:hypothetical protein